MASRLNAQSKGWQTYSKPIGSLQTYGTKFGRYSEGVRGLPEDDECIYYPTVYGEGDKLKIVSNPGYGAYGNSKTKDGRFKATKLNAYDSTDDGIYEILSSKVAQPPSTPQYRTQFGDRNRNTAAVPRSVLRALNNDFAQNTDRNVLTFEPTGFQSLNFASNNNCDEKTKFVGPNRFVSPQSEHSLNAKEDSEELLDYCTCMCIVKGTFYHFTKDGDSEGSLADQPCSCDGPLSQCVPRWGCLGVFALFFPCLWCYLPMKGCKKLGELSKCSDSKPLEKKTRK